MIISHAHKFIFLKVQKTAGTSIELALSRICGPTDVITPLHPNDEARRQAGPGRGKQNYYLPVTSYTPAEVLGCLRRWGRKRYFNHSNAEIVRQHIGPEIWDSYFKFCFERNPYDKAISHYYWVTEEPRPPLTDYLKSTQPAYLSDWDVYTLNNEIAVDFVGRYENLQEDWAQVTQRLGLPAMELPATKTGSRQDGRHYSEILEHSSRQHVENIFARELQALNYSWRTSG